MALEDLTGTGKFITSLVPSNPLSADDRREGDDHIRGVKNVLRNTFPLLDGAVSFNAADMVAGITGGKAGPYLPLTGGTLSGAVTFTTGDVNLQNGKLLFKATGSSYISSLAQESGEARLSVNDADASKGKIVVRHDQVVMSVGAYNLWYAPGTSGWGLAVQGLETSAASVNMMAIWNGTAASIRTGTSTRRSKRDISPLGDGAVSLLKRLVPVRYRSALAGDDQDEVHPGFIAEDVDGAGLSEYVTYRDGEPQALKYDRFCVLLVKAVQELTARVEALEAR